MNRRIVLFCLIGGLFFMVSGTGTGHFGWWWLAGVLTSASLVPVVRFGSRNPFALFGSIALVMVVVGIWCNMSEAVVFFPEMRKQLWSAVVGGTVAQSIIAALLVVLARVLKLNDGAGPEAACRSGLATVPLVLLAGLSYVLYYQVFGSLAFNLYTKQFYPHAVEQAQAMGVWFYVYQWGRGLLMTLAALPVISTLRMKRWQAAVAVGIMIWIVGGGAALLVPIAQMVARQRYAHILEIFTQNFSLGMTAVWLLRRKDAAAAAPEPVV